MNPHVQRMVEERAELFTKANLLDTFIRTNPIFKTLTDREQELMKLQHKYMCDYYEVLEERIMLAK